MSEVAGRLTAVERRATQNDENIRFVFLELKDHKAILEEHGGILQEHSQQLAEHRAILDEHTVTLADHSQILGEHTVTLAEHSQILGEQSQELGWLRRGVTSLLGHFDIELPKDSET